MFVRIFRIFLSLLTLVVLCTTLFINKALYYKPEFVTIDSVEVNHDLLKQLRYLKKRIHSGAAAEMQSVYPEGFLFMNVLYGLSWCELASELNETGELFREAKTEIQFSFDALNSAEGKSAFYEPLHIPYGSFYTGWNNYLLGKKLILEDENSRDSLEVLQFERQCQQIAETIQKVPYPESYHHQAWPCDVTVCVASLVLHDEFADPRYDDVIAGWVEQVQALSDSFGLIPHEVHYDSGHPAQFSRGCSQSLLLNFLHEIDPVFARQQFEIYKQQFLDYRFGLPGIREYRKGETGEGDIDSGPIVLRIGGAATLAGLRTMIDFKEVEVAVAMRNTIEALTVPTEDTEQKEYFLGNLPVVDAFIAWAHSKTAISRNNVVAHQDWRSTFQFYSLIVILMGIVLLLMMWRKPTTGS
jgi:hypothetical protein